MNSYKKVITMTAFKRPDYTKSVIDNLKNCIGFEDYLLLPTIESGYPEVLNAFIGLDNCDIVINDRKLGCGTNTLKALQRGFDISDFVIHMEDDTVPGIDSLKYFEWINENYRYDNNIFTVSAYNNRKEISPENFFTVYRRQWATGWMWATWRDRFDEMKNNWNHDDWDRHINRYVRESRYEIVPYLSRSQNIGEHSGTYTTPSIWKNEQYNNIWINAYTDSILKRFGFDDLNNKHYNIGFTDAFTEVPAPIGNFSNSDNSSTTLAIIGIAGISIGYLLYKNYKKKKIINKKWR